MQRGHAWASHSLNDNHTNVEHIDVEKVVYLLIDIDTWNLGFLSVLTLWGKYWLCRQETKPMIVCNCELAQSAPAADGRSFVIGRRPVTGGLGRRSGFGLFG